MKLYYLIFSLLIFFTACSGTDESNPVNTEVSATGFVRGTVNGSNWYSNKITTSKNNNTRVVKATQELPNNSKFSSSVLEIRISVSQEGIFGIGENEPGYTYYIKAYYKLVSRNGIEDENYKAYFDNISYMTINRISDKDLNAVFNFNARTDDSTRTISLSSGSIQIDY